MTDFTGPRFFRILLPRPLFDTRFRMAQKGDANQSTAMYKKELGTINKEKAREIKRFVQKEILVTH